MGPSHVGAGRLQHTRAMSIHTHTHTHTPHHTHTHWGNTSKRWGDGTQDPLHAQLDKNAKLSRATYLGSPTTLPMAPKPAHDLTKHMCQRAGPAGRVDGRPARLCGRSRPSCRHSRMEAVGGATRLGPSEPRRASRKLPTRSAHGERKPGRLPREGWLHRARWASSLTPVAARASTGCRDKQSTCPTCAHAPLSHRRCGSDTRHERREHWRLRRERCSQLA